MTGFFIEGATLLDGSGDPARQADVAIENGLIAATDAAAAVWLEQHPEVTPIKSSGMTVMPGMIDAHSHITFDEPFSNEELFFHRREGLAAIVAAYNVQKVLRAGVTGIFDADCIFDVALDLRDAIEANVVVGPKMTCGGNALFTSVGGTAGMLIPDEGGIGYSRITRTRDEIVTEVRRQIKNGVDWIKVHVTGIIPRQKAVGEIQVWTIDEMKAVVETAHALGIPVVGHCRNASSTRDAARCGFDMILHATWMDEEALEAVIEAKTPLVPTLTFQANLAEHGDKVGANANLQEIFEKEIEGSTLMLKRAYDAGVPILCGSESGFSIVPYGDWHWREMKILVDLLGLTPAQAVSCATKEGARALKKYGKIGTIEAGMPADVLIVDGDVASDVSVLADKNNIKYVFLDGQPVDISTPLLERRPIPGWRVNPYSSAMLTIETAFGQAKSGDGK